MSFFITCKEVLKYQAHQSRRMCLLRCCMSKTGISFKFHRKEFFKKHVHEFVGLYLNIYYIIITEVHKFLTTQTKLLKLAVLYQRNHLAIPSKENRKHGHNIPKLKHSKIVITHLTCNILFVNITIVVYYTTTYYVAGKKVDICSSFY